MPGVRDHSGAKAFAPPGQEAKQKPVDADQHHARTAFVAVRRAEDDGRESNSHQRGTCDQAKLLLQVSTKNDFLAEPGRRTQAEPNQQLKRCAGDQETQLMAHGLDLATLIEVEEVTRDAENRNRGQPEPGGEKEIAQEGLQAVPAPTDQLSQAYAAAHAENDKAGQQPLPRHGPDILQELGAGGQRVCAARSGQRGSQEKEKDNGGMPQRRQQRAPGWR